MFASTHPARLVAATCCAVALSFGARPAVQAQDDSAPQARASASPRPLGLRARTELQATLIDRSTAGQGQVAPEAAGFARGSPLAPNTPYDLFSSAPEVPGIAGIGDLLSTVTYATRRYDFAVSSAATYLNGSVTNAAYWSESLMPAVNPHVGSQALPYAVVFPTHAGQDDATATRVSVLSGRVGTADGNLILRAGWFDLSQTDRFVFAQPALTSVNPAIAYAPAESLAPSLAGTDLWRPDATQLPLRGLDVTAKRGIATAEATNAAIPSLPGESARVTLGSLVFDHGDGTRYSAEVAHLTTSGALFSTTVPYGIDSAFHITPQGVLPTSLLSGQEQTTAGVRAAFHLSPALSVDGIVEIGHAWYAAAPVLRPGTEGSGGYYHAGAVKRKGRATASFDWYRMEPRYATTILPYGVPENQWSTAFAWPGQWLKSTYQSIDNTTLGVNRQGFRVRYGVDGGPLEMRVEYTDLNQIDPQTRDTATQSGFVDGFYLPQFPYAATLGEQKRYALWTAWHPRFGDLSLDVVQDTLYRPFVASQPVDRVSYYVPQAMLTYARHFGKHAEGAIGAGQYAAKGAFSEPIDFAERLYFAGAIVEEAPGASLLVTLRRTIFSGTTTFPGSPRSPNFTGSALILEQRVRL